MLWTTCSSPSAAEARTASSKPSCSQRDATAVSRFGPPRAARSREQTRLQSRRPASRLHRRPGRRERTAPEPFRDPASLAPRAQTVSGEMDGEHRGDDDQERRATSHPKTIEGRRSALESPDLFQGIFGRRRSRTNRHAASPLCRWVRSTRASAERAILGGSTAPERRDRRRVVQVNRSLGRGARRGTELATILPGLRCGG